MGVDRILIQNPEILVGQILILSPGIREDQIPIDLVDRISIPDPEIQGDQISILGPEILVVQISILDLEIREDPIPIDLVDQTIIPDPEKIQVDQISILVNLIVVDPQDLEDG